MKHYMTIILVILAAALLTACSTPASDQPSQGGEVLKASTAVTKTFTPFNAAATDTITTSAVIGNKVNISISNTSVTARNVTIVGLNGSGSPTNETLRVNGTESNMSTTTWSQIIKVQANESIVGTIRVFDNTSGDTIATISSGNTAAYNSVSHNGTNYIVPGVTFNSSDVAVGNADEYSLWLSCGTINLGSKYNATYFVSPDGVRWFAGAVSITACNGTSTTQQLTDKGAAYIRLQITPGDAYPNQAYAKLVYR